MNCHFLLLFLLKLPPAWSSNIAVLLYRGGLYSKHVTVSHSIIVTERHLIGTQYPAVLYPTRSQCALVNPLENYHRGDPDLWMYCFGLAYIFPIADDSPINFAVFSLFNPITFQLGVSRAQIIPSDLKYSINHCSIPCSIFDWEKKPSERSQEGMFVQVTLHNNKQSTNKGKLITAEKTLYINVTANVRNDYLNPSGNGQPMYCENMVAGIVDIYPHPTLCDKLTLEGCLKVTEKFGPGVYKLKFLNLQHKTIRSLIDRIPILP